MLFKAKAAPEASARKAAPSSRRSAVQSNPPPFTADGELDARALGRALWRRKLTILVPTLIVGVLSALTVSLITPRYKSEARILFDGRENIFLRPEAEKQTPERGAADIEALTSQVQIVLSRDVARDVVKALKLNERPEFDPLLRGLSPWKYALVTLGILRDPMRMRPEERVLESYYNRLTVFPIDRTRVISIEFQSEDPELAARAANAIAEAYLEREQEAKQEQTRAAGQWLSGEITNLRKRVADAEAKVEDFRARSNLFVGTNNTTLSNQQLGEFNSQIAAARGQKADAETRARLIRDMLKRGEPIEFSAILNSDLIRRLSEQRATLRGMLAEQSSTLLDGHPRIKELKAQIADLDQQLRTEAEKLVRTLENDAKIAGARVDSLTASFDQMKRQAASTNEQDVQLRALEREARAQRDLLESYLAKYRETVARETIATAPSDTRIISRATVSNTPFFPKRLPIVTVATLATLILFAGLVTTSELMRHSPSAAPAMPVRLAADAPARAAAPSPALATPASAVEAAADALRAAGDAGRRVAVFAAAPRAGGLSALELARALARNGRVVLVDLAQEASGFAAGSTDPHAPGLAEVVRGTASFGDIITRDRLSRLHLIGAGHLGTDRSAVVASPRLTMMIEALARTYDHVVVDAGSAAGAPAQLHRIAPHAMLVASGQAEETNAARERLAAAGFADVTVLDGTAIAIPAAA
jgi:succinoglycan biosynthesis transport protein ExoP